MQFPLLSLAFLATVRSIMGTDTAKMVVRKYGTHRPEFMQKE